MADGVFYLSVQQPSLPVDRGLVRFFVARRFVARRFVARWCGSPAETAAARRGSGKRWPANDKKVVSPAIPLRYHWACP